MFAFSISVFTCALMPLLLLYLNYVVHWAVTLEVQSGYLLHFVVLLVLSLLMEGYQDMD